MEGSVQQPLHNGCKEGPVKRMKKERGASSGKSVVVLKHSDVTKRNGIVFMPNTIEMAQLKKPEQGQFKTNVQFSSKMTELDVSGLLVDTFPFLRDQRFYCAAAAGNRTRLDFHGQPRIWDGQFLKRIIKGNSALYIFTDKGEIKALQAAQNSSSSDTGICDQEMDISSNGFSETAEPHNSSVPSIAPEHMALFEVVQDIHPKSGSMEGGYEFYIFLTEPNDIRSGIAQFKGVGSVELQMVNPYAFIGTIPSSSKAGDVDVTVLDQTRNRLGMTTFRYVDYEREMVKQLVNDKEKQCLWFSKWAQECASLGNYGSHNTAQGGDQVNLKDQGQTKQQQSLQLLQLLVYTAAETGAQEFIEMIFSTSAGRTVFCSYKDKTPLPENVARANGHRYLAQYLQDVNTRLSKEVGSEAQSNAIDWLELVKAVQTQASAQGKSIKEEKHSSESDENSSDYFADSETSSHGSSGLDDANQPDSDSDSSIDKELCNTAGLYHGESNKRPATCAWQEGPSCKTSEVEEPPDSTRKKKDETKSATLGLYGVTSFCGPFDKGDISGQANVHSVGDSQECADKDHMSSQRRTGPDLKYSRIVIAYVVIVVLAGIMLIVQDNSVTTRVSIGHELYEVELEPGSALQLGFKSGLLEIASSGNRLSVLLQYNNTTQVNFLVQQLVRDQGTLFITKVNAEVVVAKVDHLTKKYFASFKSNRKEITAARILWFYFDGNFSATITENQKVDECTNNIVHSLLYTVEGPPVDVTFLLCQLENQMLDELVAVDLSRDPPDVVKKKFYQHITIDALNFRFPVNFDGGSREKPRDSCTVGSVYEMCGLEGYPVDDPCKPLQKSSELGELVMEQGRPPESNCYNQYETYFLNSLRFSLLLLGVMFGTMFITIYGTPVGLRLHAIEHQMKETTCRGSMCELSDQGRSESMSVCDLFMEIASKEELQMERLRSWLIIEERLPVVMYSGDKERLWSSAFLLPLVRMKYNVEICCDSAHIKWPHSSLPPCDNSFRLLLTFFQGFDDNEREEDDQDTNSRGKLSISRALRGRKKELRLLASMLNKGCAGKVSKDCPRLERHFGFSILSQKSKPSRMTEEQKQDQELMEELVCTLERLEVGTQVMREQLDHEAVLKSFNLFLLWKWKNAP